MATITVKLSDSICRRHLSEVEVTELRDPRHPLRLRYNTARTGGSWYIVRYENGGATWRKVGSWPAVSFRAIMTRLPELLAQMAVAPESDAMAVRSFATVGELLGWFRGRSARSSHLSAKRKAGIASAIRAHLLPRLADVPIEDVDLQLIDERLTFPLQERYAVSYVRQIFDVLRQAFRMAHKLHQLPTDPMSSIKWSDVSDAMPKPRPGRLKANDLPTVQGQIAAAPVQAHMLVLLMLMHGTRRGETRLAKWPEFDMERSTWTIPPEHTKTGSELVLPLTAEAAALLDDYRAYQADAGYTGPHLFPNGEGGAASDSATAKWVRALSGGTWSSHDLRKLARTTWADLGVDYMVGELLLNHALSHLDRAYIHTYAQQQMAVALADYHEWLVSAGVTLTLS